MQNSPDPDDDFKNSSLTPISASLALASFSLSRSRRRASEPWKMNELQLYSRTETEWWREEHTTSRPAGSYRWVSWQAWHIMTRTVQRIERVKSEAYFVQRYLISVTIYLLRCANCIGMQFGRFCPEIMVTRNTHNHIKLHSQQV